MYIITFAFAKLAQKRDTAKFSLHSFAQKLLFPLVCITFAEMKRGLCFGLMMLALLLSACGGGDAAGDNERNMDTVPLIVTRVRQCARLYTSEYKIHKIVTHDDELKLKGTFLQQEFNITVPMTERKIAIPMDATLKAYIDFENFSEENVVRNGDKIEIVLPDPKVELTDSRIDHAEIRRHVSLMRSRFSDAEMAEYENNGRAAILNSVPQLGIIEVAMENAAHALIPLIKQLGYSEEDITITFRKQFTESDLPFLLTPNTLEHGK